MLATSDIIPADKIEQKPLTQGSRIQVFRLRGRGELDGRILRVPKDPHGDPAELVQMQMLKAGPLSEFLPSPQVVRAEIGGRVRALVSSIEVESSMCRTIPSAVALGHHLNLQIDCEGKVSFLRSVRSFVEACKRSYQIYNTLPDLVGKGNIVAVAGKVYLLDFNNISGKWTLGGDVEVPLDDQGLPIFDMGLDLLYRIEKTLLTHIGGNFSTESFNRSFRRERDVKGTTLPAELEPVLVSREELKKDRFYGALRFQARREKVSQILARQLRDSLVF